MKGMIPRPDEVPSDALRLGIRADGGPGVGAGHLVRCLALAQAWRDRGGSVVLETLDLPAVWDRAYRDEGVEVAEPGEGRADVWVVDGYELALPAARAPWLRIDDGGRSADREAAVVLDQNLGASADDYPGPSDRRLLLGPSHALLRRPLVAASRARAAGEIAPAAASGPRVLLAAGGAPRPAVSSVFDSVAGELEALGCEVVVWSGADDPVPALSTCDVALAASGSTVWELCAFAIAAVVVAVADNQQPIARALGAAEVAIDGGDLLGGGGPERAGELAGLVAALVHDVPRRRALADRGRALVDGRGADRVAEVLWGLVAGEPPVRDARTTTT